MEKDKYIMISAYNTLEVIDLLSNHDELGVAEISKALNMSKSSVFRMLYTLEKKDYVHKTSDAKYKLGIKFAHYGSIVIDNQNIFTLIKPYLQKLRDKHNETTHLGILDDDLNVIFMVKESSNATIQMTSRVGLKLPFYVSAMGKVLVANKLNDKIKERIKCYNFDRLTNNTVTEYNELIKNLEQIKEQEYAEDLEESEDGLICYAVPIKDITGEAIAAISISGPSIRMKDNKDSFLTSLKKTADKVSTYMGYIK